MAVILGSEFARTLRRAMSDIVDALEPVVEVLEALNVRYRVGGSVASSALGVPRSTLDVDVVGVLRVQARTIEVGYLRRWAGELGVADLLERALLEAEA